MNGDTPVLEVSEVSLRFGGLMALGDVSLSVGSGETVGLAGANGAGKSSLLNCITGLYRISAGQIRFKGRRIDHLPGHRIAALGVGRTLQHAEGVSGISAMEMMSIGLHHSMPRGVVGYAFGIPKRRRSEREARERVVRLAQLLGIFEHVVSKQPIETLPYGTRKLIDCGRALVNEPALMLYDEPAAGLSSEEKDASARVINQIRSRGDISQVVVDHDIGYLNSVCDRVVVISAGIVIAEGTPPTIWEREDVIDSYIGRSA